MTQATASDDPPRPIRLALQGGGSHGALAWGVLDRLLEEPGFRITDISGTSAGAMNAVVLAAAFDAGNPDAARQALQDFWLSVSEAAQFSPLQPGPLDLLLGRSSLNHSPGYLMLEGLSRMFSPYELNPLGLNPLRAVLERHVDFDRLNTASAVRVHVTATSVRTGQARTFSTGEISAEAVLASACLPQMFQAVEIGGEAYWDGGFAANPALFPLLQAPEAPDLLIVQLNPMMRDEIPRSARDIINRVNEISFNTSLLKELRMLDLLNQLAARGDVELPPRGRLHMIHCAEDVQELDASSKMNADRSYLLRLFERGRIWAGDWLDRHGHQVGRESSFDLGELFRPGHRPAGLEPPRRDAALHRQQNSDTATQRRPKPTP